MSSWVSVGAPCSCVARGGRWLADGEERVGPTFGDEHIVTRFVCDDEGVWIGITGWPEEDFDARLFKPLSITLDEMACTQSLSADAEADA
jgi:hypothetical protein